MTSQEFVTWFKGFVSAANTFNITPKQWDNICEQLEKVDLPPRLSRYTMDLDTNNTNWTTTTITADGRNDVTYKKDNLETKTILND
jgi:hypothetical protein